MKKEFNLVIEVHKTYNVTVEAESAEEAVSIGQSMDTLKIYQQGSLATINTEVISIQ